MTDLKPHALANIFPDMSHEQINELRADIKANGLLDPITLHEGKILDGRHRYRCCRTLRIEPRTVELPDGVDPLRFVVSKNMHRRHMKEGQRSMVARKVATMKTGRPKGSAQICALSEPEAAEMLNVSRRSVQHAKKVHRDGVPELVAAVEEGKMAVSRAAKIADMPKDSQLRVLGDKREFPKIKQRPTIRLPPRFRSAVGALRREIEILNEEGWKNYNKPEAMKLVKGLAMMMPNKEGRAA